ncbi:MAG: T9SS type A sorting domain-containing protein, partial [Phaeodactylibacter sp.]|nr:T9SS type A sorting domain-containing protein [Phaeodactylibacter sp.]
IIIEQNCDDDEVAFTIKNVGSAPTAAPLDYTIVEDLVMYMEGSFDLEVGEEHLITLPGNGSTWRAEAEQEPGHPGVFQPAAWVEGCGGLNSTGLVNAFPTNNNDPFLSVFCDEVIAAFDPNDKVGFPQGRGANKLIRPNQDIEYRIRFQNTGTDTAFKVVIVDALSSVFQRASFRPGASSHPYELDIDESGIVHFIFNDILLPDSTTNPGGSIGFVKFRIAQLPDLEPGTNLNNEAAIYFDAEAPVITNLAWHTIEDTPQVTTSTAPLVTSKMVSVFPNPALDHVAFLIEGEGLGLSLLTLFDGQGRLVKAHSFTGKRFVLKRGGLASGVYFYRLTLPDGQVSTGKLLLKD